MSSSLLPSFEGTLEFDYVNFLRFCESHHSEETLKFWADVEDFRARALELQPMQSDNPLMLDSNTEDDDEEEARDADDGTEDTLSKSGTPTKWIPSFSWFRSVRAPPRISDLSSKVSDLSLAAFWPLVNTAAPPKVEQRMEMLVKARADSSTARIEHSLARNLAVKQNLPEEEIELMELARAILFKYIDVNSPQWVCLPEQVVDKIEHAVDGGGSIHPGVFDEAQHIAFLELKTSLFPLYAREAFVIAEDLPAAPPPQQLKEERGASMGHHFSLKRRMKKFHTG